MCNYADSEIPFQMRQKEVKMKRDRNRKGRWFAAILAGVMFVAVLSGCGKKDISGTYAGTVDMTEYENKQIMDSIEEQGVQIDDVNLEDVTMDLTLDLNSDNTFTMTMDLSSLLSSMSSESNARELVDSLVSSYGATSDEDYESFAQYAGYDSYDDLVTSYRDDLQSEDASDLGLSEDDTKITGTWSLSGNTITLTSADDGDLSMDTATLNNDGTISLAATGEEDGTEYTFDMTFTKTDTK